MVRKIILAVLVLAAIGICTGFYMWNKKAPKAEDAKGVVITADGIARAYAADEQKANAAYLDKVLELSGTVSEVSRNQDSAVVVILDSGDPIAGVQCTMRERSVSMANGQQVVLKGFCRGNNMGVVLTDCIVK